MKIQCEQCREIVPIGDFRLADGGIEITCRACGESFFVAARASAGDAPKPAPRRSLAGDAPSDAVSEDQMRCPKCGLVQPRGQACRSCGLREDLFEDHALEHAEDAPPELEAMWECCEADWDNQTSHDRFAEGAAAAFAFAYGARRYRGVLRRRPDDAVAHRQLDRLSRMAEATLMSSASARKQAEAGDEPYKNVIVLLMVLVLVGGIAGMYLLLRQANDVGSETREKAPVTAPAGKR